MVKTALVAAAKTSDALLCHAVPPRMICGLFAAQPPDGQGQCYCDEFAVVGMGGYFYDEAAPNAVECGRRTIPVPVVET